jgi:hypothetical protein
VVVAFTAAHQIQTAVLAAAGLITGLEVLVTPQAQAQVKVTTAALAFLTAATTLAVVAAAQVQRVEMQAEAPQAMVATVQRPQFQALA